MGGWSGLGISRDRLPDGEVFGDVCDVAALDFECAVVGADGAALGWATADLIYSAIASFDGFTADGNGDFDWAAPDEEVHAFVNDKERPVGT